MKISTSEIREKALAAYEQGKGTQKEIAHLFGISSRTFQRWLYQYYSENTTHPKERGHRVAVYEGEDLDNLDRVIQENPDATLAVIRNQTGKSCLLMAVQRAVIRLGYSLKNAIGQRTKPS